LASVAVLSLLIVSTPITVPEEILITTPLLDSTCEKHGEAKNKNNGML
jgi:hypothetical protein